MVILLEQIALHPRRVATGSGSWRSAAEFLLCQSRARLQKGKGTSRQLLEPRFAELSFETGVGSGGTKASYKDLLQAFPKLGCFSPSISKESFGDFGGFQGIARAPNQIDPFPNFFVAPGLLSASFQTPSRAAFCRLPP
jgi:hypothetical protein